MKFLLRFIIGLGIVSGTANASTLIPTESYSSELLNKYCSYIVGVPYASDDFTDAEWDRFVFCREQLRLR